MILKGSERGGSKQLAAHLLKTQDNDHVEVYEVRGFLSNDLRGAMREAYAISKGTKCKKFLFSLSLNPPETARVSDREFKAAIRAVEAKLGLENQPRIIVFHEKEGRRHAHCVWSRIDTERMRAINLPHFKLKLRDVSKKLFMEHGWKMPCGLVDSRQRDPTNFTRAEWRQAKRNGHDPKALKAMFQECWAISDSGAAFAKALEERGYWLARGDRGGFVVADFRGEIYSVARYTGLRTKEVKAKLGDPNALRPVSETKALIAARMTNVLKGYVREALGAFNSQSASLAFKKSQLAQHHRHERQRLKERQEARWREETARRTARLSKGFRGAWDRLTGKYGRIRRDNEREAYRAFVRDQAQKQTLIEAQLRERQALQKEIVRVRQTHAKELAQLHRDVAHYTRMNAQEPPSVREHFRELSRHQNQTRGRGRRRKRGPSLDS